MTATEHKVKLIGNDPIYERWRWQIFGITWLAYAGFYLTRRSFTAAKIGLGDPDGMGLTKADLAWVDAGYLTAYAAGQFLWGICGDKFGTRVVILIGMFASVATAVAMGASSWVVGLGILNCVQGVCQSTGWAPLAKNMGNFFSQHERGRVMGLWCTNYGLGGFVGLLFAGWAAGQFGWRFAFWIPAGALFLIWLLFWLLQRNRPEDVGLPPIEEYHGEKQAVLEEHERPEDEPEGSWIVIREVMTNPMVLLLAAVYLPMKLTRYFMLNWSTVFLNERLGTQAVESSMLSSMFDLAGLPGVLVGGYLSDKVFRSRRMPISVIALVVLAVLLVFFNDLPATRVAFGLGFFAVGFLLFIPDSLVSGAAAIDFGTKKGASTAAGIINGSGSIGAIIGGTAPGWIGYFLEDGKDIWGAVFITLAASLIVAAGMLLPKWNALPATAAKNNG